MEPVFAGRDGSLQVVGRTDMEVYWFKLLRGVIIHDSMMLLACAGAAETFPADGEIELKLNLLCLI